ncbi:MAG: hypothetical protein PVH87_07710 [Desulfobacteraceae bacterium]|jgi:hypothetical protein
MKIKYIEEAKPFWDSGQPLKAGEILYEHIREIHRPLWAKEVLELCIPLTGRIKEVEEVVGITKDPERWKEAHDAFSAVRDLTLKAEGKGVDSIYSSILYLAENVAKVTYNASGESAPFDHDSGYWIVSNLRYIVDQKQDESFEKQAWHIVSCEKYAA